MDNRRKWIWTVSGFLAAVTLAAVIIFAVGEASALGEPPIGHLATANLASVHAGIDAPVYTGSPLVIPAAAFSNDGLTLNSFFSFTGGILTGADCWEAPVYLPNGAVMTQLYVSVYDNDATYNISASLYRKSNYAAGGSQVLVSIWSSGQYNGIVSYWDTIDTYPKVTLPDYSYYIGACGGSNYTGFLNARIYFTTATFIPFIAKSNFPTLGFDSQFNGSVGGWASYAGLWYIGANYLFTAGDANLNSSAAYINRSFSTLDYQARMIRYGCNGCANRLYIRGTPSPLDTNRQWHSLYEFQYSRDGDYSVWKYIAGMSAVVQNWTSTSAINQGDAYNTLRVIATGSKLYFFINGTLVWSGTDTSLTSGIVGVGMYRDGTSGNELRVDWATLYTTGTTLVTEQVSPEQQLLNEAANLAGAGNANYSP